MKALIFGITGQDGSYLAEILLEKGYEVTGVTRRTSTPNTKNISHILQKITLVEGDVTDGFNVTKIIQEYKPDEIYNLAAQSHVGTSFKQPNLTTDITYVGVLNILEAIRYSDRKDQVRFYQASSSEMFGKNFSTTKGRYGDIKFQDENTPFLPQSPYAIAKLAAHHLVRNYRDSYGIHGSCGILFNHESERRGENFVTRKITKWIGEFINFSEGRNIGELIPDDDLIINKSNSFKFPKLRLGNLEAKRDWGHAEDYVNAMWLMLQQETPDDYVICTGETYTIRQFLDIAFKEVGIEDWSSFVVQDPEFYRPAEVDYLLGSCKKAEQGLNWRRDVSFNDLVQRMVDYDINEERLRRSDLQAF